MRVSLTPSRRRSQPLRAVALAVLGALLLAEVAGLAHLLVIRHGRCVEHGEVVELPKARTRALELAATSAQRGPAVQGQSTPDRAHPAHDHCAIAATSCERTMVRPEGGAALQAPASEAARSVAKRELSGWALAVYTLAPKNSPPIPC